MRASDLQPAPRCPIICEDSDTHAVVQCARWVGHVPANEHLSYDDVLVGMYTALCATRGLDPEVLATSMRGITLAAEAKAWYKRLVLNQ
jgi:hypothetical protein